VPLGVVNSFTQTFALPKCSCVAQPNAPPRSPDFSLLLCTRVQLIQAQPRRSHCRLSLGVHGCFLRGEGQCSEPSRGPTGTAGIMPRGRDGTRQDGTASRRPVQGKGARGPPG